MKTRFSILFLLLMFVIILLAGIVLKIKSDKKRKSLVISSSERDKDIKVINNEPQEKRPYLTGIPSWALALIAMVGIFIVLMVIGEGLKTDTIIGEVLTYIMLGIVNAICCFLIVRQNPKSIWYVPLILNVIYVISVFVEAVETLDWIAICGILALSLIASIIGARMGRKETVS
jgi:hypothetical protein